MTIYNLKNRILDASKRYSGLVHQMTAGAIGIYTLFVISFLVMGRDINYYTWRQFMTGWSMTMFSTLFVFSLCWQSWLGLQNIIRSYLNPSYLQTALLYVAGLINLLYYVWGLNILWDIYI